jgi:hypothetical protein
LESSRCRDLECRVLVVAAAVVAGWLWLPLQRARQLGLLVGAKGPRQVSSTAGCTTPAHAHSRVCICIVSPAAPQSTASPGRHNAADALYMHALCVLAERPHGMPRHHTAARLTGGGLTVQLLEDATPPSRKGSSHASAGSALSMRTKLPLAANGQSSSASSKVHAFGLQGARWIAFDVLTRKRHCRMPTPASDRSLLSTANRRHVTVQRAMAGCRCEIHITNAARHCCQLDQERRWAGKLVNGSLGSASQLTCRGA